MKKKIVIAGLIVLVLGSPPVRLWLESSMFLHMFVQMPLLIVCGAVAADYPAINRATMRQSWNEHGVVGLIYSACLLALLMIPRVLDLSVLDGRFDCLKFTALLLCGAALRLSWKKAGTVMQSFFLGNVLPMTAVVGNLYQDAAVRVCNVYRLTEQQDIGLTLVCAAWLAGVLWLIQVGKKLA